jgi:hypothetical protein
MLTLTDRIIVTGGEYERHSVHTAHLHHRDFPELWTEGNSTIEGAERLLNTLAQAREAAESDWHRDALQRAWDDVGEYLASLGDATAHPAPTRARRKKKGR